MKSVLLLLCAAARASPSCISSITTASGHKAPAHICSGDLIFNEEFNSLDFQTWNHEKTATGGGNWEFQIYLNNRSNSFVRDGKLFIRPTLTSDKYGDRFLTSGTLKLYGGAPADACTNPMDWGCERRGTRANVLNPITSARIRTVDSFRFCYGKVEVRAKMPAGDWLWPGIWMLPHYNEYGSWPASGEIDLCENRGNRNLTVNGLNIGTELTSSTLHFGPYWPADGWEKTRFERRSEPEQGFDQDFHRFQVEWTKDYLQFAVDGEEIGKVAPPEGGFWEFGMFNSSIRTGDNPWISGTKMAPFDKEFYFIINLAVGGINGYFPDNAENPGGKPWSNNSTRASTEFWNSRQNWLPTWKLDADNGDSAALQVDYIKVWAI